MNYGYHTHGGSPSHESGVVSDCDTMAELATLLRTDIPEGRANLTDNHTNLERVAEYCEANYFQSENKRVALEETKNYTTQSLASVAYQINTLAYNFLQLLDLQSADMVEMESQINNISQTIMIHKEKVARREIGVLTANKCTNKQYKIIAPAIAEKPIKYLRKPIDYTIFDEIGHGVKSANFPRQQKQRGSSQSSIQSASAMSANSMVGPAPTTKPPTPPQISRTASKVSVSGGTLSKANREYRTPPAVAPPQVPSHYAPNYPLGHHNRRHNSDASSGGSMISMERGTGPGYSTLPLTHTSGGQTAPSSHYGGGQHTIYPNNSNAQNHPQSPPPPPPPSSVANGSDSEPLPPPPMMTLLEPHTPPPLSAPTTHAAGSSSMMVVQSNHHNIMSNVPHGSMGMHTLSHHHQQQQQRAAMLNQMRSGGGSGSPPLPPPPLPDDVLTEHENFGRPRASGVPTIVPDEDDLPGWVPKNYIEKVVAIYDYYADKDDELSFQESAVIYVLKKNDDGWWEGVMDGITGLFPGNYVEPCV